MTRKAIIWAAMPVVLGLPVGCVAKPVEATCAIESPAKLPENASQEDVCRTFRQRLGSALADRDYAPELVDLHIVLSFDPRGTVSADAFKAGTSEQSGFERISLSVMDRPMVLTDIEQLADALAAQLSAREQEKR